MLNYEEITKIHKGFEDKLLEIRRQTDARLQANRNDFNTAHALATTRATALEARISTVEGMVTHEPLIELTALISTLVAQADENQASTRNRIDALEKAVLHLNSHS